MTDESVYLRRRTLLRGAAGLALGAALGGLPRASRGDRYTDDLEPTRESVAARYNNFYEFGPDKDIQGRAQRLTLRPWSVRIDGLVERPTTLDVEQLARLFPAQERIYRFRCVEAWAMVVPWTGFPLRQLLAWAGPKPEARYVRFRSFHRPSEAWGQLVSFWHPWPYTEGLTLAEARHELVLIATGIYGKPLPAQHGAPLRLVVPWKYGFKSLKSIERIELVRERPATFWNDIQPDEYDFDANVNPWVPHPRWSQATERLLGTDVRQPTLLYNGYEKHVAGLYT